MTTLDGIGVSTLHGPAEHGPRPVGTADWQIRVFHDEEDPAAMNAALRHSVAGGAEALLVSRDDALDVRLAGIDVPVLFQSGPAIDAAEWVHCGATEAQQVALVLAAAVDRVRDGQSLEGVEVRIQLDPTLFLNVAILRALRRCWDGVMAALGLDHPLFVQVGTAPRSLTCRDAGNNVLRNTTVVVAAALGGADAIVSEPEPSLGDIASRVALNTQHVLKQESHLGRFRDPTGGSYAVEALTDQVANTAWSLFQQIEGDGGLSKATERVSGWLAEARTRRGERINTRQRPILGVTVFPNLDDAPTSRANGLDLYFELLRKQSDAWQREHGGRPVVALDCEGTLAQYGSRAIWVKNLLAAGGLEGIEGADSPVHIRVSSEGAWLGDRALGKDDDILDLLVDIWGEL
jgi:methylmalonyl-CoA mutase